MSTPERQESKLAHADAEAKAERLSLSAAAGASPAKEEDGLGRLRPSAPDLHVDCHYFAPMHNISSPTSGSPIRTPAACVTRPKRIIIVRHGESMGNIDEQVYTTTPDWKVPLSQLGIDQARETGLKIKEIVGDEPLYIYTSPYLRAKQTLDVLLSCFADNLKVGIREEPRITEQQFGNLQNFENMRDFKRERSFFGRFYYRFPQGESGLDVYTRVTSFISTMFRDFADMHIGRPNLNVIIVTHGLTLRLLLMRWFKFEVATFEATTNPPNGAFVLMTRKERLQGKPGGGYELCPKSADLISLHCPSVPLGRPGTPADEEEENV